jgi:hypothetical protein
VNRRGFLKLFGLAVAGVAIDQAIPLGRVWSFPSKIVIPSCADTIALQLEKVREQIPLVYGTDIPGYLKGIPYYYADDATGVFMGIERKVSSRDFRIPMRFPE